VASIALDGHTVTVYRAGPQDMTSMLCLYELVVDVHERVLVRGEVTRLEVASTRPAGGKVHL